MLLSGSGQTGPSCFGVLKDAVTLVWSDPTEVRRACSSQEEENVNSK